eukprot:2573204-Ditylum_brightwellii.AAC.1
MRKYEVDIFAFVETNIPWTPKNRNRARKIATTLIKNICMEMGSSSEPSINGYQPGGTLVGVRGNLMCRILEAESDTHGLGRWSHICLTGEGKNIHVVSAYMVAQEDNNGIHTAFYNNIE